MEEKRSQLSEVDMELDEECGITLSSEKNAGKNFNLTITRDIAKEKNDPTFLELKTSGSISDTPLNENVQFSSSLGKSKDSSSFEKSTFVNLPTTITEIETDMNVDERESSSSEEGGSDLRTHIRGLPTASSASKSNESVCFDSRENHSFSISEQESMMLHSLVPKVNCQEKCIICIDTSSDMNQLPFKLGNGSRHQPLSMVKRVADIFVHNKHNINKKHEFALVALNETASWVSDFSGDIKIVCSAIENSVETRSCDTCDLASLFRLILENTCLPSFPTSTVVSPFVLRVILIYGRSNCVPEFKDSVCSFQSLKKSKNFFFDVIYIHEPPSDDNKCQEIFETFCDIDSDYTSYVFELTRNTTKLHNCMAKLLCHPLQRPVQKDASYKLQTDECSA